MNKKALKILGITALLGAIGYLAYKHLKKSDKRNATANSSGSIGTKRFNYKNWDKNRPASCNKDFNCKSFLNSLDGLMEFYNTNDSTNSLYFSEGFGVFKYDVSNNLWFFSIIKGQWIRQLVPSTYNINPNVVSSSKASLKELGYAKKMCDAVVVTDSYLKQKLDFNSNGCVTKIKPPKPSKGSSGGSSDTKCALQCGNLPNEQAIQECMYRCTGGGNIKVYKSAIGTSQYNN